MKINIKDKETGDTVPYIHAKERCAKRMRGLGMIKKDMEKVVNFISSIIAQNDDELAELRWHGALISYGRCFVSADGRGMKLESHHVKQLGHDHLKTHNKVMELRHQYIAHSGKNREQNAMIFVPLYGDLSAPEIKHAIFTNLVTANPCKEDLDRFLDLAKSLLKSVENLFLHAEKSVVDYFSSKSPEELLQLLQNKSSAEKS